jgi:hypothetical protein
MICVVIHAFLAPRQMLTFTLWGSSSDTATLELEPWSPLQGVVGIFKGMFNTSADFTQFLFGENSAFWFGYL